MKHAISNIALPQYSHHDEVSELAAMGFLGLEIAPSRCWSDTWHNLSANEVARYRADVESAGLQVVGLHSLLFDQPDLSLCDGPDSRNRLADFFVHLSGLCRDLGGRTLIWGGGRTRGATPARDARLILIDFFSDLCSRTADHGTVFCLEPLAPADTDFLHSVHECKDIVDTLNQPGLKVQIDVKALTANNELNGATIAAVADSLVHVHANEPGFEVLGSSKTVDHNLAGAFLRDAGYEGYVSIEQKTIDPTDVFGPIQKSLKLLQEAY